MPEGATFDAGDHQLWGGHALAHRFLSDGVSSTPQAAGPSQSHERAGTTSSGTSEHYGTSRVAVGRGTPRRGDKEHLRAHPPAWRASDRRPAHHAIDAAPDMATTQPPLDTVVYAQARACRRASRRAMSRQPRATPRHATPRRASLFRIAPRIAPGDTMPCQAQRHTGCSAVAALYAVRYTVQYTVYTAQHMQRTASTMMRCRGSGSSCQATWLRGYRAGSICQDRWVKGQDLWG